MNEFSLQICTPEGVMFDGKITSVSARSTIGDICILRGHANYMTTIEKGKIVIKTDNDEISALCSGGFISVNANKVRIFVNSFE